MPQLVRSTETVRCSDAFNMPGYLTRPEGLQRLPALVMVFDVFGLSSEMKRVADDFAVAGYAVLMPDLCSRGSWFSCIRKLMKDLDRGVGQGVDDLMSARTWLGQCEYVEPDHIGVIGFCMGGGFALLLSKSGLFQVAAPFYGKSPERLDGACPIVGSFGGRDKMMAAEPGKILAETKRLGIPSDIKVYPDAGHSFMSKAPNAVLGLVAKLSPMHAEYDAGVAQDAMNRVVTFLRTYL